MDRALQRQEDWYHPLNQPKLCTQAPNNPTGTIGVSAYAAKALGDVVYVELPSIDLEVNAGESIGAVESVKSASDIMTPVGGKIVEANSVLEDKPDGC
jgi:glycine cleavage system H protein